eukprot:7337021-Lingulodinium_polyedra.AAC.1
MAADRRFGHIPTRSVAQRVHARHASRAENTQQIQEGPSLEIRANSGRAPTAVRLRAAAAPGALPQGHWDAPLRSQLRTEARSTKEAPHYASWQPELTPVSPRAWTNASAPRATGRAWARRRCHNQPNAGHAAAKRAPQAMGAASGAVEGRSTTYLQLCSRWRRDASWMP